LREIQDGRKLPQATVRLLNDAGHDAISVADQCLVGHPDYEIEQICRVEQRIIVMLDLDFADIRSYPPADYCGIVVLRSRSQAITELRRLVNRVIKALDSRPIHGKLWIVDEHRIRIRE
jgi:predicted nuclease of predicted toxin-antitoxin system